MRPFTLFCSAAIAAACATPALAQSPFDGTWKGQLSSMKITARPDVFSVRDGVFSCSTCTPAITVKADGAFHAAAGHAYWDEMAVRVVDPRTVAYSYRKSGKVVTTSTDMVAAGGRTLISKTHTVNNGKGVPIDSTSSETRLAAGPPGSHMVSGSWKAAPATSLSDAAMTLSMKLEGDRFHLVTSTGETLDARIGGGYAINTGDPGKTMTKVKRLGPRAIELTDMRLGKVTGVSTYTVSADGRMIDGTFRDPRNGSTGSFRAMKQ